MKTIDLHGRTGVFPEGTAVSATKPRYRFYMDMGGGAGAWILMDQFDNRGNSLYQPEEWPRYVRVEKPKPVRKKLLGGALRPSIYESSMGNLGVRLQGLTLKRIGRVRSIPVTPHNLTE